MAYNLWALCSGLIFLTWGAEWLVRGASKLARAIGVSPLAIGLTIVAYGTSTPELVVNIGAALTGKNDIAIGNIVGSNIFNILFILGACALIAPLQVSKKLVKIDVPIMILTSGLFYILCFDYKLSRWEGGLFILGVLAYTLFCFISNKKEKLDKEDEFAKEFGGDIKELRKASAIARNMFFIFSGLGLLVIGSKFLIDSSVAIARYFGISELVIALTIVAAGTSLPEMATSIVATVKGERDIAIGNVIGSNIYNILAILGVTVIIPPQGLLINPGSMVLDIPFMVFVALLCYPIFRSKFAISRRDGLLFFGLYIMYTVYLIRSNH